jgi:hypothetical protein
MTNRCSLLLVVSNLVLASACSSPSSQGGDAGSDAATDASAEIMADMALVDTLPDRTQPPGDTLLELRPDATDDGLPDSVPADIVPDSAAAEVAIDAMHDAAACEPDPAPPGAADCPDACTGGCADGVCTIDCVGQAKCEMIGAILCPQDYACVIVCEQLDACDSLAVWCPDDYACELRCDEGKDACGDVVLHCGSASCTMACGDPATVCDGAQIQCGPGACSATCENPPGGPGATQPEILCGESCDCLGCN